MKIFDRVFYHRDTVTVARELVGAVLVRQVNGTQLAGKIVETEAYCSAHDPASHAHRGKTKRNTPMFEDVGHAYVYFIYGNHFCFNIVAKQRDVPAGAVLIRAVEPIAGIDVMQQYRRCDDHRMVTNGPGKLAQAFSINKADNNVDLTKEGALFVVEDRSSAVPIVATERIGITVGKDKLWRFCAAGNPWLSRKLTLSQ